MTSRVFALALSAIMFAASAANAKSLYVDPGRGNDSTSYAANSESSPWRTLGRAVWGSTNPGSPNGNEAARAGDVVLVAPGAQSAPASGVRYSPAFNPANSGTASAPIIFRALGAVTLSTTGGRGPVIGTYRRNYITWEGPFSINEANAPPHADTGPVVLWETTGSVIDGCEIVGAPITYADNHNGVRLEYARNSVVRNCRITNIYGAGSPHHNEAGVMLYFSNDIIIENNEISSVGSGIFPKGGDNYNITVRYNRITNTPKGIRATYSARSQGSNRIYQNIVENLVGSDNMGIQIAEGAHNWTVANNTIVNVSNGVYIRTTADISNVRVANNIVVGADTGINAWEWNAALPVSGNLYFNVRQWAAAGRTYSSLSAWQTGVAGDANARLSDPQFNSLTGGDYHLAASSPARPIGQDVLSLTGALMATIPAGAYITGNEVIGRRPPGGGAPPPPAVLPNPPSSISVN